MLFLIKQVKHHNVFIYYTKYKSSLYVNQAPTPQKNIKNFLNFSFVKMTPLWPLSLFHTFSAFFPPKIGSRPKIVQTSFHVSVARGETHLWVV